MADENEDESQKTEDPTQKRLQEAYDRGDAPRSQDVVTLALLSVAAISIAVFSNTGAADFTRAFTRLLSEPHAMGADGGALLAAAWNLSGHLIWIAGLPLLFLFVTAILANLGQAPAVFAGEKLQPDLQKISPLKGFERLFGKEALVNFGKGLVKVCAAAAAGVWAAWPERGALIRLIAGDPAATGAAAIWLILKMLMAMLAVIAVFAVLDYAWQRWNFMQRMKMSKQELKDELRQTEGDPLVKMKIRQLRMERGAKRMMANVPKATVVVTNPTHYAVALRYEQGTDAAPVCVAKGLDNIALKIREVAGEANVPIVENPPLARALYRQVEVDREIPVEHYKAVAQIIGFVMKKRKAG
jgi:flagellar biosynthesis protein FlhB